MTGPTGATAPASSGAEQATKRRGQRGNGRRIRRRIVDAQERRERARRELTPMDPWRSYVLARIDVELGQLHWEVKIGWTGEPGQAPPVPRAMPRVPLDGVLPREVVVAYLRPWNIKWKGE